MNHSDEKFSYSVFSSQYLHIIYTLIILIFKFNKILLLRKNFLMNPESLVPYVPRVIKSMIVYTARGDST